MACRGALNRVVFLRRRFYTWRFRRVNFFRVTNADLSALRTKNRGRVPTIGVDRIARFKRVRLELERDALIVFTHFLTFMVLCVCP
jgi:hypothetical protein